LFKAAHTANVANYKLMHSQATYTKAECQPKSKHNCKTHLQSYDKITSYTTVGTFRQKESYLLCRTDEIHPSFFRSPPSLATKDLVLERVVLIHRPACTHKTQKGNRRMLEENLFVVATCT